MELCQTIYLVRCYQCLLLNKYQKSDIDIKWFVVFISLC